MSESLDVLKLRVLLCFLNEEQKTCTVTGLAGVLGEGKQKVSRIFMALEREGLLDRSNPRRPCLTEAGRARAAYYEERTNVVLNHLLYEGLDIDSALHDAYAWALMSSDEGMALIRSSEQRYRAKYELRRQQKFDGAELCRRLPDGSLKPVALPVWKWETFYIGIIRSVFNGTWGSEASGKAVNYWWGLQSDAERVDYYEELAGGTRQLLNIIEENLRKHELAIFPSGGLYAQGHVKMVPQGDTYTPKELMEMDWLGECVEGALPLYEDLDVKTRGLMEINGLGSLKGMPL